MAFPVTMLGMRFFVEPSPAGGPAIPARPANAGTDVLAGRDHFGLSSRAAYFALAGQTVNFVACMLGPVPYALPNQLVFALAGIVLGPYLLGRDGETWRGRQVTAEVGGVTTAPDAAVTV